MDHYRLVIVDAHEEDRYLINLSFQKINWADNIKILDTSERLLNYLKSLPGSNAYPSIIVFDYDLPHVNGAQLLVQLKQDAALKHIPLVVYAGNMAPLLKDKLLSMGANHCFTAGNNNQIMHMAQSLKEIAGSLSELPRHY